MIHRSKATIRGIVQGIGFRPFIFNLAREKNLRGYVLNTQHGVELDVEGDSIHVEEFFNAIESNDLPLAHITSIERDVLPPNNYQDFSIRKSIYRTQKIALTAPDMCVCQDCLNEMNDPDNRRYRYPFINCTNCGPRYTIIKDIPYDRPSTTMNSFHMCNECMQEYYDPVNRRFHAQPNACPACGPHVQLYNAKQEKVCCIDPIKETANLLKQGYILAIKGLGGFHLAVDAENDEAVQRLRLRKYREEKPLALMSLNMDAIRQYAQISRDEEILLTSAQRPIVLLLKKQLNTISPNVAPGNNNFGVMLPYTPLHHLLLYENFLALVMTSGNTSEEPIVIDNDEAFNRLGKIADYFLVHNRNIYLRSDDSVIRRCAGKTRMIRRSRGYAPYPVFLPKKFPQVLACGAELKNTICLTKDQHAILSQHIGDLKNQESYEFFELTVDHLQKLFDIYPEIVAYDLHPNYISTQYALEKKDVRLVGIQHHHAHIVSCMTEHGLEGPVIGLSFDGTGYGIDGKIWGGEVLLVEPARFDRLAHLGYVPMPGGDAAIKEPWRMAVSYLFDAFGDDVWNLKLPLLGRIDSTKIDIILEMIRKRFNCPETSSLGRLFDGIASILGICHRVSFEGQAAISLEMIIEKGEKNEIYQYAWEKENGIYMISPGPIIQGVVHDYLKGTSIHVISHQFHLTLVHLFTELCKSLRNEIALNSVVLSGGVFQNATLLTGLLKHLHNEKFDVFTHSVIPTNDGGIALGQAAIAEAIVRSNC